MVDSPKIADFVGKARQNIDQIKIGLLRHDKNPKDREFLNDISKSVHSIKNRALPIGLARLTELCHNLEALLTLIREGKKELHQEIIITIAACKDRLEKFIFELETVGKERSKVKDLVRRIQQHIDEYNQEERQESNDGAQEVEIVAGPSSSPPPDESISSLLPDEIKNREYDEELFQIFVEQVQENISLLRALTNNYPEASNPTRIINQCSDLVGKLQSSANYMGYDALAEFYLQWVAELEMAGVELSIGSDVSFQFMDEKIRLIADLFPEINDVAADPAALEKEPPLPPPSSEKVDRQDEEDAADADELQEMFSGIEDMQDEEFQDIEPIAALSEAQPPDEEPPAASANKTKTDARPTKSRKQSRPTKKVEIDASYFEREKASEDHDEELFQIFTQQLQENITRLQELNNNLATEPNKTKITEQCSNLLGKLQSSANYMGYEQLVEYYLQWIAELEMAGVELSLGSDVSFDFMQEKINRIISIFPEISEGGALPEPAKPVPEKKAEQPLPGMEDIPAELAPAVSAEEAVEDETPAGLAALTGVETGTPDISRAEEQHQEAFEEEADDSYEDIDKTFESFFEDIGEPEEDEESDASFMEIAAPHEEEPVSDDTSAIAGISELPDDDEEVAPALSASGPEEEPEQSQDDAFSDALNEKLTSFFGDTDEPESTDTAPAFADRASLGDEEPASPAEMPADDGGIAGMFEDDDEEEEEEDYTATAGTDGDVAPALFEEEPEEVEPEEPGEFSEAVDEKLESFFTDIEIPEEDEELETSFMEIASLSEEEPEDEPEFGPKPAAAVPGRDRFAEDEGMRGATADEMLKDIDAFFGDEEVEEPAAESIAGEGDARPETETASDASEITDEIEAIFAEEEPVTEQLAEVTEAPAKMDIEPGEITDEIEAIFAEDETLPAEQAKELESPAEEEQETAVEETFDEIESFFAEEEPVTEQLAEVTKSTEEANLTLDEVPGGMETIFAEEETAAEEEPEQAEEETFDEIESFFAEGPASDEQAEEFEAPAAEGSEPEMDEAAEELENFFYEDEEEIEEEQTDEFEPATLSEEMLSDEELLEEIEGPTVGHEIQGNADSLEEPDLETAEQIASALPGDQAADEELFRKLEEAISAEDEPEDFEETADEEFASNEKLAETPPERRELYQKLNYALRSLEEEQEDVAVTAEDEEQEFDTTLYDLLASALDKPSEKAERDVQRPIDHVLEEILSTVPMPERARKPEQVSDDLPKNLAAAEIKEIIRMDTDKVEQLMDQLGELNASRSTLVRLLAEMNELHQHYLEMEDFNKEELKPLKDILFRFSDTNVSLNRLSNEIREGILNVRMAPIGLLFERYPQLVEELAAKEGKQINLEIVGEDTELEKLVIDDIAEPLTHIITNTIEHGIESVEERRKTGKEEVGTVRLEAYQEDNEIVIEVMDNGRGIDLKKVKAAALNKGLFSGDELYAMSDNDLRRLILNPDFSTITWEERKQADRGEGLHITSREIQKLKGTIDIRSTAGKGTIIQLRVPLNLLVVRALKVKAGKETMALPVNAIEEIIKVRRDTIHFDDGIGTVDFRGESLPVHRLTEIFDIEEPEPTTEQCYIVIVQSEGQTIGLIVDEPAGVEEIVIKPIGEFLRRESGFSGVTIISDGNLSLVPDTAELIRIVSRQHEKETSPA